MSFALSLFMKTGIAHWQGRISPVFDVSNNLCVVEIVEGREISRENITLASREFYARAKELCDLGIQVLLCGAISNEMEDALARSGISVKSFICGSLEEVIEAYIKGILTPQTFMMPGCCGKRRRLRLRHFQNRL